MESSMTKLPTKELLDGTKEPVTTTGEFRLAMGNLRQFLFELLGDESTDKETARRVLGIDVQAIFDAIERRADSEEMTRALSEKASRDELEQLQQQWQLQLKNELAKQGVPVGTMAWFAMTSPPFGYRIADGSVVRREDYPDLFAVIGTTFGEGDGHSTFQLPDLIGRFAEGSMSPGTVKAAGLPNIEGSFELTGSSGSYGSQAGAFYLYKKSSGYQHGTGGSSANPQVGFDASLSNPVYGTADTVQPPALTLLPCIKTVKA